MKHSRIYAYHGENRNIFHRGIVLDNSLGMQGAEVCWEVYPESRIVISNIELFKHVVEGFGLRFAAPYLQDGSRNRGGTV